MTDPLVRTGPDGLEWHLPYKGGDSPCDVCKGFGGFVSIVHWSPCFSCVGTGKGDQLTKGMTND